MQTALRAEVPIPIEEIIRELETARQLPEAAIRAAVARPDEIQPAVIAVIESAADGALLLPAECNLALFGMHALAAARRTALYGPLVRMMRALPDDDVEWMFGVESTQSFAPILLSTFDGDASSLIEAVMDPAADGYMRWTLWLVLARLTFDGAIAQPAIKALLERFERENLARPADPAWKGWQEAIILLGLEEFRGRMRATWADGRNLERLVDRDAADQALSEACAAAPGDPTRFEDQYLVPLSDPVEALSRFEWTSESAGTIQDNLASPLSLDSDEMRWMDRFLNLRFGDAAQAWEAIDGFCCAIAVSPPLAATPAVSTVFKLAPPAKLESPRQTAFFNALLARYLAGVRERFAAGRLHRPPIASTDDLPGAIWASFFLRIVVECGVEIWKLEKSGSTPWLAIETLMHLAGRLSSEKPLSRRMRDDMIAVLPLMLRSLYQHFRGMSDPFVKPRATPDFPFKVGRNHPCPCGSGKKYKRCCGGAGA